MSFRWFLFFFKKSVSRRKGRVTIASLSVMLAVAVITGMIGITYGITEKLGSELKAYGANLMVTPDRNDYIDYSALVLISGHEKVEDARGQVFGTVSVNRDVVEIIGLDTSILKEGGWRLSGGWPEEKHEMLAGINLKNALKLKEGLIVTLGSGQLMKEFTVSGFIERGGDEDNAFIMSIEGAWELTGSENKLSAILVRGGSGELENIRGYIKESIPSLNVKTLRQVAVAEESLLRKIQLLMALVTLVVLFAASVSVAGTMGANVLERREEIGLMQAIGATRNNIASFYIAEAVMTGFLGGTTGYVFGFFFTQAVSWGAFDSFIGMPLYLPPLSVLTGLVISLAASHFPVREAMKHKPAVILREE
jgi:putative ABC transport system permease protein